MNDGFLMRITIPQTEWMDDDYHGYFFNVSGSWKG